MSSPNFDILYPKNERQGFDGGLNDKYEKHLIEDNESPDCQNVTFDHGAVETRLGSAHLNTTSVGSFAGHGLYTRHTNTGNQTMLAWWNGSLYECSVATFTTVASAQSIFTAGVRVGAAEYENYIFFGNGNNPGYKYNGAFSRHGVPPPTVTFTAASGGTGALSGGYVYRLTNVNSNLVESDLGPASATFVASANQIALTSIPTAPLSFGINTRNLYRTKASATTFFFLTNIANNTASSFVDNTADSALGVVAPDDQGQPPNYSTIITHQNRLFCNDTAEPNLVWYSELGDPYTFKTDNFELIGDNSGDLVKGFAIHDNGLIVFTDNSEYLIYMTDTDPANWSIIKTKSAYGSKSPFGSFSYNNKIMFPAVQNNNLVGFAAIAGNAIEPSATILTTSSAGSDLQSDRIEPDIFDFQSGFIGRISSVVFKNKAYMAVTKGTNNTTNNRVYVFDFSIENLSKNQEASWAPSVNLNAEQFTIFNGKLYYISSLAEGFVYELNKSASYIDQSTAIDSYFWTKNFSGNPGDEQFQKDFRYINILYEKSGAYFMDIFYRTDSSTADGTRIQVDLNPGGALWDQAIWDVDVWDGGDSFGEERISLGQARGKRIQFKFSNQNTINQKFKIIGLQFSYNRKGRR